VLDKTILYDACDVLAGSIAKDVELQVLLRPAISCYVVRQLGLIFGARVALTGYTMGWFGVGRPNIDHAIRAQHLIDLIFIWL